MVVNDFSNVLVSLTSARSNSQPRGFAFNVSSGLATVLDAIFDRTEALLGRKFFTAFRSPGRVLIHKMITQSLVQILGRRLEIASCVRWRIGRQQLKVRHGARVPRLVHGPEPTLGRLPEWFAIDGL